MSRFYHTWYSFNNISQKKILKTKMKMKKIQMRRTKIQMKMILVLNVLMMPLVKMVNAHARTGSREMAKLVKVMKINMLRLDYIIYQNECKV